MDAIYYGEFDFVKVTKEKNANMGRASTTNVVDLGEIKWT